MFSNFNFVLIFTSSKQPPALRAHFLNTGLTVYKNYVLYRVDKSFKTGCLCVDLGRYHKICLISKNVGIKKKKHTRIVLKGSVYFLSMINVRNVLERSKKRDFLNLNRQLFC